MKLAVVLSHGGSSSSNALHSPYLFTLKWPRRVRTRPLPIEHGPCDDDRLCKYSRWLCTSVYVPYVNVLLSSAGFAHLFYANVLVGPAGLLLLITFSCFMNLH